jgi:hypothetical protein
MHHGADAVVSHRRDESRAIGEVGFDERAPAHRLAMSARQVVKGDRPVAGACQGLAGMAPDITGAAGHQDRSRFVHWLRHSCLASLLALPGSATTRRCRRFFRRRSARRADCPPGYRTE